MSASPSAYVGVGLQGNERVWWTQNFAYLHSILFPTSTAVAARDSGLVVNAVQPGGPAEGKVCESACL
jgi:hypothetical protein